MDSIFLAAALRYIRLGWLVFPLAPREKVPLIPESRGGHGCKDATLNEAQALEWWTKQPSANVGLATGHRYFAIDIDPRRGGDETWDALRSHHAQLPQTIEAMTGGGGRHILYQMPDFPVRNSKDKIGSGIEIKGVGGYIVAPPSIHPETGRAYEWDGLVEIEQASIAAAPAWLLELLKREVSGARRAATVLPAGISEGARNDTLFRAASRLRRSGWSADEIFATLRATNQNRCRPPLTETEVRRIADSAAKYTPEPRADLFYRGTPPGPERPGDPAGSGSAGRIDSPEGWRNRLIRCKGANGALGDPRPILANAMIALREAPEWRGVVAFNEFSLSVVVKAPAPFHSTIGAEWTDQEDRLATNWLQHQKIFVSVEVAGQAVQAVARDRTFHPVREYLNRLKWDGVKRIEGWLNLYLGVEPTDYSIGVGQRFLRSAVARIMEPGCKVDTCLILEGEQGIKKSTALKTLAWPYFTDEIADLGSKDAALQTRGVWLIEIAELDGMTRADVGKIKAFMSRAVDRFRPPYGRHLLESPRQCIFAGSVNHGTYLRDDTGGRRFWPVACTRVLIDELARDRDQLWAEALASYRTGAPWWLDTPELNRQAEDEQSNRFEESAWDGLIMRWVDERLAMGYSSVSVAEILDLCIGKRCGEWTRADEMRVGGCLIRSKWKRVRERTDTGLQWRYKPPVPTSGRNRS